MKQLFTKLIFASLFIVLGFFANAQSLEELMKEGDKWEIVIPSKLGYGERGAGAKILVNSMLVFEVELISMN